MSTHAEHHFPTGCDLIVEKGVCTALFAFDIAYSIDLDRAERAAASACDDAQRDVLRHTRKTPSWFGYRPAPLRTVRRGTPIRVGAHETDAVVTATLYDFGAISVAYTIPITGDTATLKALSLALDGHAGLAADAGGHASSMMNLLGSAAARPSISPHSEDFVIFHVEKFTPSLNESVKASGPLALESWRRVLAAVLRAEASPLSQDEVDYTLSTLVSYGDSDAAIVDWNAAVLFGPDMEDVLAVLEFANVELLEMRLLDDELDRALERAHRATTAHAGVLFSRRGEARLRDIAALQVDSALLFEGVNNTLKMLGDQYLARVYRAAVGRFHLPDWDASILRKLSTLDSIYEKLNDRRATRRMEVLEWIIILLIAFEVAASWVWPAIWGTK
ncbi:MAG: hypothetical protein JNK25_05210 [Phycisphaerae bacterium]|nr:hypothetical protein [Phycisphaerae bacterium]